jgi:hypothetical protein
VVNVAPENIIPQELCGGGALLGSCEDGGEVMLLLRTSLLGSCGDGSLLGSCGDGGSFSPASTASANIATSSANAPMLYARRSSLWGRYGVRL